MSWAEIKGALNGSVGTIGFATLDEIMDFVADRSYYDVMAATYGYGYNDGGDVLVISYGDDSVDSETVGENQNTVRVAVLPRTVVRIDTGAFSACPALERINFPHGISRIEAYAFSNCSSLTSIVLPNSISRIGYQAFNNCSGLKSIEFRGTVSEWLNVEKEYDSWISSAPAPSVRCKDGEVEIVQAQIIE